MGWTYRFDLKHAGALLLASLIAGGTAIAGPPGGTQEGLVKRAETGDFFFVDKNNDKTWQAADDAKFRIQGGTLTAAQMIVGDFDGTGQSSVGLMDDSKYYIDADSSFTWAPAGGGELVNFFAPGVGMTHTLIGDFDGAGGDDPGSSPAALAATSSTPTETATSSGTERRLTRSSGSRAAASTACRSPASASEAPP